MTTAAPLGAPGVYATSDEPLRALTGVRMDVCAFVGVAPRGPAREPVAAGVIGAAGPAGGAGSATDEDPEASTRPGADPSAVRRSVPVAVESWEEYADHFGGFEGPGLLPYAVHSFFQEGGRRAYVVRIVHAYGDGRDEEGAARGALPGLFPSGLEGLPLRAAATGEAGNGLRAHLAWATAPVPVTGHRAGGLALDASAEVETGELLRLHLEGGGRAFAIVASMRQEALPGGGTARVAVLEPRLTTEPVGVDRVRAEITVEAEGAPVESLTDLGLSPTHPRWAARVLADESDRLRADPRWLHLPLLPDSTELAPPAPGRPFGDGRPGHPATGRAPGCRPEGDGLWLRARSEGRWGDHLRAVLDFRTTPVEVLGGGGAELAVPLDARIPRGALLRLELEDGTRALRFALDDRVEWSLEHGEEQVRHVDLDSPLPAPPVAGDEVVGDLRVFEEAVRGQPGGKRRSESIRQVGFTPDHPRWIHRVLTQESRLVRPDPEWRGLRIPVPPELLGAAPIRSGPFAGGEDRYADVVPEDFFDPRWSPQDDNPGEGVHSLLDRGDLSLLVVPDLYAPGPLAAREDVRSPTGLAGPRFSACVDPGPPPDQEEAPEELEGLRLDSDDGAGLARIGELQARLVDLAEARRSFVVLLDVPPGLSSHEALRWRSRFRSSYAAAYHPWLRLSLAADGRGVVRMGPAPVAAGIVARQERAHGVQHGPANALAVGVVDVVEEVSPATHDRLHPLGINVFLRDRDGVRLMGARTLSRRAAYRQLSVRRLMTFLGRVLERQMQWTVFEPNDFRLQTRIKGLLTSFLRELHRANAFAGASEDEAFFVRCDETINRRREMDAGRLLAQVGVAPAEPMEFLVLRVARNANGTVEVRS